MDGFRKRIETVPLPLGFLEEVDRFSDGQKAAEAGTQGICVFRRIFRSIAVHARNVEDKQVENPHGNHLQNRFCVLGSSGNAPPRGDNGSKTPGAGQTILPLSL